MKVLHTTYTHLKPKLTDSPMPHTIISFLTGQVHWAPEPPGHIGASLKIDENVLMR